LISFFGLYLKIKILRGETDRGANSMAMETARCRNEKQIGQVIA